MADTKIEWCDKTWNPVVGCTKCSPGCLNCYAERMAIRLNGIFAAKGDNDNWADYSSVLKWDYSKVEMGKAIGWNGDIALKYDRLDQPLHWREPKRIFVCSMSDLFHPKVPFEFIEKIWDVMLDCINIHNNPVWLYRKSHTFQILTKRIDRALEFSKWMLKKHRRIDYSNVHFGVSISTQAEMWKAKELSRIPAAVRWISFEPLLGDVGEIPLKNIGWVVVGCESGPKRRTCKIEWIQSIVDQCKAANIPCFVKQIHKDGKVVKMPKDFPQALMKGN